MNKPKLSKETETKPDGYTVLGNVIVFEVDNDKYTAISIPFDDEEQANSFIKTMKIGMYYTSMRPDLKLVAMRIVNVA
jgi:hypothetical protein